MIAPFLKPNPPKLSCLLDDLRKIESSSVYSNFGPVNTRFEAELIDRVFGGVGACITVCNATIGLMLAIREALHTRANPAAKYAIMPSFTFAATPQAALWCGLTPLLYDIDRDRWLPSPEWENLLIEKYGDEIGVIVPYATFGNCLDVERYDDVARRHGIPVVIDAAASLGSVDAAGRGFGAGSHASIVYSMHATKTFSTSEGGLIYSSDKDRIERMRVMSNFGFSEPRRAGLPGLNGKLSEISALLAQAKLEEIAPIVARRGEIYALYRELLPGFTFQSLTGQRTAHQFVPALLPSRLKGARDEIVAGMRSRGFVVANYFSPHIAEQPYFQNTCRFDDLPVTSDISSRVISLPLYDDITEAIVRDCCAALNSILRYHGQNS